MDTTDRDNAWSQVDSSSHVLDGGQIPTREETFFWGGHLGQPSPTCRTAFPAQHLRPSGVLSRWPGGLELTPGFYPGSNEQHRLF